MQTLFTIYNSDTSAVIMFAHDFFLSETMYMCINFSFLWEVQRLRSEPSDFLNFASMSSLVSFTCPVYRTFNYIQVELCRMKNEGEGTGKMPRETGF